MRTEVTNNLMENGVKNKIIFDFGVTAFRYLPLNFPKFFGTDR